MARARKQIDYRALAEALTDGSADGFDMDMVARRLGLAKPTLYRLAGSRERLIELSVDAETERLLEAIHRDGIDGVFRFAEQAPAGVRLLFASGFPAARTAQRRLERRLRDTLRRSLLDRGEPLPDDLATAAAGLLAMAAAIAYRAVASGRAVDAERMRSDFDFASNIARAISDSGAVNDLAGRT